jgi:SIR2-like domain/TIR domain
MAVADERATTRNAASDKSPPLKVFINYRRADAGASGLLLYESLAARFGPENVFLDVKTLQPGMKWLDEIRAAGSASTAFIALIGPRWASTLAERAQRGEDDHVKGEIELAIKAANRGTRIVIVPALLDGAEMPTEQEVPQPLRPLLARQIVPLRLSRWEADVEALIDTIERVPQTPHIQPQHPPEAPPRARPKEAGTNERGPSDEHFEEVKKAIVDGSVVIFLGPGANSSDRVERRDDLAEGEFLDDTELAAHLKRRFGIALELSQLPTISQYVAVAEGPGYLYRHLRTTFASSADPSSVHQFLAHLPKTLHESGHAEQHQLIVTTNYDNALEQAFTSAEEPYDLAVYMASDGGRFAHFPSEGDPVPIQVGTANSYKAFPIDHLSGDVSRTVIVKIHGAVDGEVGPYAWQDNYVITEDDYIDYLSQAGVESIVPLQIRNKLRWSHFLFLGYAMRDWNLRVFIHRMFGKSPPNTSWAIQRDPEQVDAKFWRRMGVEFFGMSLSEYVSELERRLRLPE